MLRTLVAGGRRAAAARWPACRCEVRMHMQLITLAVMAQSTPGPCTILWLNPYDSGCTCFVAKSCACRRRRRSCPAGGRDRRASVRCCTASPAGELQCKAQDARRGCLTRRRCPALQKLPRSHAQCAHAFTWVDIHMHDASSTVAGRSADIR